MKGDDKKYKQTLKIEKETSTTTTYKQTNEIYIYKHVYIYVYIYKCIYIYIIIYIDIYEAHFVLGVERSHSKLSFSTYHGHITWTSRKNKLVMQCL